MTAKVRIAPSQRVTPHQRRGVGPTQPHPIEKHPLHGRAPVVRRQTTRTLLARRRVDAAPPKRQFQRVAGRHFYHGVGTRHPIIRHAHRSGVTTLVVGGFERTRDGIVAPDGVQPGVVDVGEVEASVGTEGRGGVVAVVIHEIVRGEAEDAAEEVTAVAEIGYGVGEGGDGGGDAFVGGDVDAWCGLEGALLSSLLTAEMGDNGLDRMSCVRVIGERGEAAVAVSFILEGFVNCVIGDDTR